MTLRFSITTAERIRNDHTGQVPTKRENAKRRPSCRYASQNIEPAVSLNCQIWVYNLKDTSRKVYILHGKLLAVKLLEVFVRPGANRTRQDRKQC